MLTQRDIFGLNICQKWYEDDDNDDEDDDDHDDDDW